jgi:hypothetical protein
MARGALVRMNGSPVAKAVESDNLSLCGPCWASVIAAKAGEVISNAIDRS